jgi:hypothetical protein
MIVVLAIDALEYELVEKFNCASLRQTFCGKTDISEFSEPRTMVLWSSFLTGENKEEEILARGKDEMWNTRYEATETFLKAFTNPLVIDLPGFSYDLEQHRQERELLKAYFDAEGDARQRVKEEYNNLAFEHHRKIKQEFTESLDAGHDFLLGYFSLADVIGHLNFDNMTMMRMIYRDFDDIAAGIKKGRDCRLFVLSDHGMKALGPYGDHSGYGFWSSDSEDLGTPRLTHMGTTITAWTT